MKRLVLIALTLVFVLSFATIAMPVAAKETQQAVQYTGVVVASQLRVRSGPSNGYGIVGFANWGVKVTILGRDARASWIKVRDARGTTGWVSVFWVRISPNTRYKDIPLANPIP